MMFANEVIVDVTASIAAHTSKVVSLMARARAMFDQAMLANDGEHSVPHTSLTSEGLVFSELELAAADHDHETPVTPSRRPTGWTASAAE